MDAAWWRTHLTEVRSAFTGELVAPAAFGLGVPRVKFRQNRNSGAGAVALAAHWGASKVILLGYDLQRTGGRAHWHGDHPRGLGNAGAIDKWPQHFEELAADLSGVEVVNCSRESALEIFPRGRLEDHLVL